MENKKQGKDYNWIIFAILSGSAVTRFIMNFFDFNYVDYFVAAICAVGLSYTMTSIVNEINRQVEDIIKNSECVEQAKNNKIIRHKRVVRISIFIVLIYCVIHILIFSSSVANDMLSMVTLGLSLTDESIINYFVEHIHI